jgi:ATP-binding cassette, subfamily B, bacterial PglK
MLSVIDFIRGLDLRRKSQIYILLLGMLLSNIAEVFSIALIPPYLAIISDNNLINTNEYLIFINSFFNFSNKEFIIFIGFAIFFLIVFSNIFLAVITYLTKKIQNNINNYVLSSLFNYFINLKFEESFLNKNGLTKITQKLNTEVTRFTTQTLLTFFEILKKSGAIIIMFIFLFFVEPIITIFIIFFSLILFVFFYKGLHKNLVSYGIKFTDHTHQKLSLVLEAFSALKEVKFLGIQNKLMREFFKNNIKLAKVDLMVYMFSNIPRYFLEILSAFLFLSLLIYFVWVDKDFTNIIYTLSFVAVAAYKILPSLNSMMFNYSVFNSSLAAYHFIKDDLDEYKKLSKEKTEINDNYLDKIHSIELYNVYFNYPNSSINALSNINFKFNLGKNYFIIGSSGSGKSTLIDLVCGIVSPSSGFLKINSKEIDPRNYNILNKYLSYVPQQINFFNRTILENITLNFDNNTKEDIDFVHQIIEILELKDFVNNLENGINSYLGEKIQNISGGQRQRLSIARAIFRKKPILVLDEATSAIDINTERLIFDRIQNLEFVKTMIAITHRESTLKIDDNCIKIDNGIIVYNGLYKDLKNK